LAGEPLWAGAGEAQLGLKILNAAIAPPSARAAGVPAAVDAVVVRATSRRPEGRYATAREMAAALFEATPLASSDDVAAWVAAHAGDVIAARAAVIEGIERAGLASLGARAVRDLGSARRAGGGAGPTERGAHTNRRRRARGRGGGRR
jgi:serine/threonine-protein kinase